MIWGSVGTSDGHPNCLRAQAGVRVSGTSIEGPGRAMTHNGRASIETSIPETNFRATPTCMLPPTQTCVRPVSNVIVFETHRNCDPLFLSVACNSRARSSRTFSSFRRSYSDNSTPRLPSLRASPRHHITSSPCGCPRRVRRSNPFAYAQLSHMPVTGRTVKQVGHTLGDSSSLARALFPPVYG